jgi:hypothetical protein
MPNPKPYGRQGEGGEVVASELVEACCDAAEVLELVEEPLDQVALAMSSMMLRAK